MVVIHFLKSGKYEVINPKMRQVLIPATFINITVIAIDISYPFFKAWKQSLLEVEKYKIESAKAQLQNIKNQLNPHFLFNNLSVLSSLVYQNQDKAVDFINELSKVYRYAIDYTLDQLESAVSPKEFFRINRKIILYIKAIEKVSTYFNCGLSISSKFLFDDANLVSRERVNDFKAWLDS